MKLNEKGLQDRAQWEKKGYRLPNYDRKTVKMATKENPFWIHFGPGNIFRAFQANVVQTLLNKGEIDRGLIVAEGYDYEIVQKMNQPCDDYSILVTLKSDGTVEKTVIGSIVESLTVDVENEKDWTRLKEIFRKDSLQMASFTITEKGYRVLDVKNSESYMGKIATLLYERYKADKKPIAMVSMDNCSHNGDKLKEAIQMFAKHWVENQMVEVGFLDYINDKTKVSFPWSMIDKITPRPDEAIEKLLRADGIEGLEPVITSKNTYVAPFVNAEETEYLVIEDEFPNGRQEVLEQGGFLFTERQTVDKVEKMKVCTCLNPLHTSLAIFGCLLGYEKIAEEMKDPELIRLVKIIGYIEGLPVVVNPKVLNPKEFLDKVLRVRIPNPFMPDTPQRIATDTSQKLAIRFGETIKAYQESKELNVADLKMIPLVFAGWIRYLMGIDDNGRRFELSPDPMLDKLRPYVANFVLGKNEQIEEKIKPLLEDTNIWGVNLYEVGLAQKVVEDFEQMTKGLGAVRETLKKQVWA